MPGLFITVVVLGALPLSGWCQAVKVDIRDEKSVAPEAASPIDPVKHITAFGQPNFALRLRGDNKALHLGYIFSVLKVDGPTIYPNAAARYNQPLPKSKSGKARDGFFSVCQVHQVRVTQTVEIIPSKAAAGGKRKLDTVLVRYTMENEDRVAHSVGMRVGLNSFLVNNPGALFSAPNFPGKVLDGVELTGAKVPSHLQIMQQPNPKDPGATAYFTFALGGSVEKPAKVLLTSSQQGAPDNWSIPAVKANGNSAVILFWEPRELKPKAKREVGYAFGLGIASALEHDANLIVDLGGSFEPGKLFTVSAYVSDPAPGQALTLELPSGLERAEGKEIQPVPQASEEGGSLVLWKARVVRPGQYRLSIHSNTGITQTKIVTVTAN